MGPRFLAALLLLAVIPCAYAQDPGTSTYLKKTTSASSDKLDQVLAVQEEILKQLQEIKNELYIVKIRSTK